jgi:hypothetical protein
VNRQSITRQSKVPKRNDRASPSAPKALRIIPHLAMSAGILPAFSFVGF